MTKEPNMFSCEVLPDSVTSHLMSTFSLSYNIPSYLPLADLGLLDPSLHSRESDLRYKAKSFNVKALFAE